ncbi:hypothetical protein RB620_22520 [Paenibacillus sp. LHD-117]|nr:hypothetical protein [Paenibacillus sp. LHD-117]MDQ6422208.1 hypothetical protein [Paenibacillus sp. LHD-117]
MRERTEEDKLAFYDKVMGMDVFDTHSHLVGDTLGARRDQA